MGDHAVVATVIPLSPDKTLVRTKWLVNKDAVEGVDYDLDKLTSVWTATTRQDADLVARSHKGIQDPRVAKAVERTGLSWICPNRGRGSPTPYTTSIRSYFGEKFSSSRVFFTTPCKAGSLVDEMLRYT